MANSGITMREKENPPRVKEEYSITRITIRPKNPNVKVMPAAQKPAILKHKKPLVKELKGPYNKNGDLVLNVLAGETYTYKATKFEESTFTPIKHIWFAEQLDNGEIIDLEYNRGVNPYMDKDNEKYVCYDYTIPENVSEVRIYAYCWKPTQSESIVSKVKSTVVFYIGGASDKEGFYGSPATEIVKDDVADPFLKLIKQNKLDKSYQSFYLGYNEVRGDGDIKKNIIAEIPNKEHTGVFIVGHSLGGWNGAHLSEILSDKGYDVKLLITLDPVGVGGDIKLISDIYWTTPTVKADYWINITAESDDYAFDDFIADAGGQWKPKTGMQINDICNCHHGRAGKMFNKSLKDTNISASDMLLQQIELYLSK